MPSRPEISPLLAIKLKENRNLFAELTDYYRVYRRKCFLFVQIAKNGMTFASNSSSNQLGALLYA